MPMSDVEKFFAALSSRWPPEGYKVKQWKDVPPDHQHAFTQSICIIIDVLNANLIKD